MPDIHPFSRLVVKSPHRRPAVVGVGAVALLAAVLTLSARHHQLSAATFSGLTFVTVTLVVGLILARHLPRNPIGWLLLAIPVSVGAFVLLQQVVLSTYRHHPLVAAWAGVLTQALYFCFLFTAPLVLLFFPDGALPSPRWRRVLRAYLACAGGQVLVTIGWGVHIIVGGRFRFDSSGNMGKGVGPGPAVGLVMVLLIVTTLGLALSWVVRRIVGYRRTSGVVRQQFKWLALGAVCLVIALVVSVVTPSGSSAAANIGAGVTNITMLPFPIAVGVAVLRYRLYDIDRVISRTLSYTLLTGSLVGLYVGLVTFATRVLPFSSPVAVAASTLVAAALFNPLRRRLQHRVDRRFNRARFDAEASIAAFAGRLQASVDLDGTRRDLLTVVYTTLQPRHASIWLSRPTREARSL